MFNSNYDCNLHHLWDRGKYWSVNANSNPPQPYLMPQLAVTSWNFGKVLVSSETKRMGLQCGLNSLMICFSILTQWQTVIDGQTDGQTFQLWLRPHFATWWAAVNTEYGTIIITRGQSNLTKSASRGANSPVRGHPRGSKVVPLNSRGRVSY